MEVAEAATEATGEVVEEKVIAVGSNGQSFIDFQVPGTEGIYRVNIEETGIDDYFDRYALTKADGLKGSRRFSDCFEGLMYCD